MDDQTFELLKRIDAAFDGNLPGYGDASSTIMPALFANGDGGDHLRRDIMRAVEAEKARRTDVEKTAECRNPDHLVSLAALKASLEVYGR